MPDGFASKHLVTGVVPGTVVRLAPPAGEFVLPDPLPAKALFLAAGSGITPIIAMLRSLDRRAEDAEDLVVVHSAPDAERALFADELDLLGRRHPGWRIVQRHTRTEGHLEVPAGLDEIAPDWRERQTWACGPAAMLDDAEQAWKAAGVADALHLERFAASFTAGAAGGTITFAKSGRTVEADGATTVLQAGEQAGIPMPFGCRMGICHTCVAPLASGGVRDLRDGSEHRVRNSSAADSSHITVQTCVTAAAGDCTVDL